MKKKNKKNKNELILDTPDMEYLHKKLLSALGIPKEYLGKKEDNNKK